MHTHLHTVLHVLIRVDMIYILHIFVLYLLFLFIVIYTPCGWGQWLKKMGEDYYFVVEFLIVQYIIIYHYVAKKVQDSYCFPSIKCIQNYFRHISATFLGYLSAVLLKKIWTPMQYL